MNVSVPANTAAMAVSVYTIIVVGGRVTVWE
jgi:hypothetical protein